MRIIAAFAFMISGIHLFAQTNESLPYQAKLRDQVKEKLCLEVKKYFEESNFGNIINVGDFTSSPNVDANYSNGIKSIISQEFQNLGYNVNNKAPYYLQGTYRKKQKGTIANAYGIEVKVQLIDDNKGEPIASFKIEIDDYAEMGEILGVTGGYGKINSPSPPAGEDKKGYEPYYGKIRDHVKEKVCQEVKKYYDESKLGKTIAVADFTYGPNMDSSDSNGIKSIISQEFKSLGYTVDSKSDYYIKGEFYKKNKEGSKDSYVVGVKLQFCDANKDDPLKKYDFEVDNYSKDAGNKTKVTNDKNDYIEVKPNLKVSNQKAEKYSIKPEYYLKDGLIRANENSPYAVRILVKYGTEYEVKKITEKDGRPYVDLKKGDIYKIELVNDSKYEAAAKVLVDGLNTFYFSELKDPSTNYHKRNYHIIDKYSKSDVLGWEKNDDHVYEFLTESYGLNNELKKLKPVLSTGVITVSFSLSYDKNNKPSFYGGTLSGSSASLETVKGKEIENKTVTVLREIGPVLDTISIRYSH